MDVHTVLHVILIALNLLPIFLPYAYLTYEIFPYPLKITFSVSIHNLSDHRLYVFVFIMGIVCIISLLLNLIALYKRHFVYTFVIIVCNFVNSLLGSAVLGGILYNKQTTIGSSLFVLYISFITSLLLCLPSQQLPVHTQTT